ncbi:hypothetical protein [Microbacterium sp.]|uniref:hypothetical protein n=1 Tax=Microbacterium sp. TaxID=51671 RepID=UPI0028113549|nr:hypothetical protein [Microbacterium sp.]
MSHRTRALSLIAAAAAALTVAVIALLRMLVPGFLDDLPTSIIGRFGTGVELAVALSGALGVLLVVGIALASQRSDRATAVPLRAVRAGGLVAATLLAATTPGGVIPAAGYTFALTVVVGITVFVTLTVLRRPWLGIVLAAVLAALVTVAIVQMGAAVLIPRIVGAFGGVLPQATLALAHVIAAAGLVVWMITGGETRGGSARFVLRHRVAITVIGAACALPYAFARATWLTPWPLFGGSAEMFAEAPEMRLTGLLLGLGMLIGGVLTLGLIMPWGERFPRFLAWIGGRAVPPGLAVIPATVVSVLFTAAGIEFALEGVGAAKETLFVLLMFPFWLWGPMLGLAAWAYAMRRRERVAESGQASGDREPLSRDHPHVAQARTAG